MSSIVGIVFSLEKDEVWANWPGSGPPIKLGRRREVEAMMRDFLGQSRVGDRLLRVHGTEH